MNKIEAKDLTYGGKYYGIVVELIQKFFSDLNSQIEYVLANCTLAVYVCCKINGLPIPANTMPNARLLHTKVANGWEAIKYKAGMTLLPNDIVEWDCNHVAYVIESGTNPQLYASWWTDYEGKSQNKRNSRLTKTIRDTVEYFYTKYDYRFFHQTSFEDECNKGGGKAKPKYIIRYSKSILPVASVERDESKEQIFVSSGIFNVRSSPEIKAGNIVGTYNSPNAYFDVYESVEGTEYNWHRIGENFWIAQVGEITYYTAKAGVPTVDYEKKYNDLVAKIKEIDGLAEKIGELCR